MAKNEAKITFRADTAEFESKIKSANSSLTALRAGLKLNEAEFKNTGNQVEYLKNKHNILEAELEQNKVKQEALRSELELAKSVYGQDSTEVDKYKTKLANAQTEGEKLKTAINQVNTELQEQQSKANQVQSPLEKLTTTIDKQETELKQLKTDYANVVLEQGKDSTAAKELKGKIDTLNTELNENQAMLDEVTTSANAAGNEMVESAGQAESASNGGWSTAKAIFSNLATTAIQLCITKLKEFATDIVETGMTFSTSMSNVQALSGATAHELELLEEKAKSMGETTKYSASEVADGFSYMALAGWSVDEMLEGIEGTLNLATAASMDLGEASDIVTDYLTAFGLSADDAGAFVDEMAYAMANSNTDVTQLGEAYKNCASTATSLGVSVEEVTACLSVMANAGVKGGEAGTTLSAIMVRLATDTKGCNDALAEYGVQVYDSEGNVNELSTILEDLGDVWSDLSDKEQAALAKTIAGQNQYSGLQTLMNGLSEAVEETGKSFGDYEEALYGVKEASEAGQSAAEDMAHTMSDNLEGDITICKSAWEGFEQAIYETSEGSMRDFVQSVSNELIPSLKDIVTGEEGAETALGTNLSNLLLNLVSTIQSILPSFIQVSASMVTSLISGLITSFPSLVSTVLSCFTNLLNTLSGKLPELITQVSNMIPKLVTTITSHIPSIINAAIRLFNGIITALPIAATNICNELPLLITNIQNQIIKGASNMKEGAITLFNGIIEAIPTVIDLIGTYLPQVITGIVETLTSYIDLIVDGAVTLFSGIAQAIPTVITSLKTALPKIITSITTSLISALPQIITAATTLLIGIVDAIPEILPDLILMMPEITLSITSELLKAAPDILTAAVQAFTEIVNAVPKIQDSLETALFEVLLSATEKVEDIGDTFIETFESLLTSVKTIFNNIKEALTTPISEAKITISSVIEAIKALFTGATFEWPHIKTPHFSISPSGWKVDDLLKGSIPTLSIAWYAKGAVFDQPTIIPTLYGLKGVGEAGPETVAPIKTLQGYIEESVYKATGGSINYDLLGEKVADAIAKRPNNIYLDKRNLTRAVKEVMA